jgi:DDE superfamily endonuclease
MLVAKKYFFIIQLLTCPFYFQFPTTENEWKLISEGFTHKWNFPHCVGAVDGKHVRIIQPPHSGSYYYNYKGFHSLVLLAIVNSNYEFILANFGINGRVSDGGVIENTQFYGKLKSNDIHLPDSCEVGGNNFIKLPFVFVGDEAFALRPDFLKPFAQKDLTFPRKIFNYRLSRARNVVENAFGILASRFRIFHTEINMQLRKTEWVVLATCALHNLLRRKSHGYLGFNILDITDTLQYEEERQIAFADLQHGHNRHAGNDAKQVRNMFMDYFMEEGQVPWQRDYVVNGNNYN